MRHGFTLIELSIVLVIIGLIVGGILTGQELIRSAEQRAQIAQIEKYNTAVNTFRSKYNGIPGDLLAATASSFGITNNINFAGTSGIGDGNGLVNSLFGNSAYFSAEPAMFWLELSASSLIDGNYISNLSTSGAIPTAVPAVPASTYMPPAKLGRGNYIIIGLADGANYFVVTGVASVPLTGLLTATNNITALEAYNMDKKTDDGMPNTGTVRAVDAITTPLYTTNGITTNPVSATAPNCVTAASAYAVSTTAQGCSMIFRFN